MNLSITQNQQSHQLLKIPSFKILANEYLTPRFSYFNQGNSKIEMEKIANLEQIIVFSKIASLNISFPFSQNVTYTIRSKCFGFSKKDIIDEIRKSYRAMFRASKESTSKWESTNPFNKDLVSQYHVSYPFSNLFVENVFYDSISSIIDVDVNAFPELDDSFSLPF